MSSLPRRAGTLIGVCAGFAVLPALASASAVDLGTAGSFVVLGGSTVTNTGPSVLNGDLGVAPGTALTGFPPGIVNGATHANDAVALQAQADLVTAYGVAAGQGPTDDLSGTDLGGRTLTAKAYNFTTSAQLTGQLTLDAQGNTAAQFVFEIGTTLTTASASSVRLINGANACNVFWQVGSSATLGTTTAFQGNILALASITLNTGANATGRMLARNGAVTLDTNTLLRPSCNTPAPPVITPPVVTPPPAAVVPPATAPPAPVAVAPPGATLPVSVPGLPVFPKASATPPLAIPVPPTTASRGSSIFTSRSRGNCTAGFRGAVRGRGIKQVGFRLDGRRVRTVSRSPFQVYVLAAPGAHRVTARVTFTNAATRPRTLTLPYHACAAAVLHPVAGPAVFTG